MCVYCRYVRREQFCPSWAKCSLATCVHCAAEQGHPGGCSIDVMFVGSPDCQAEVLEAETGDVEVGDQVQKKTVAQKRRDRKKRTLAKFGDAAALEGSPRL